jgi:DNA-binding transcriptional ArsR family regulator
VLRTARRRNRGTAFRTALDARALVAIVKFVLNQQAALDGVFQALADPTRRVMVQRLTRGPASVSELAEPLAMSLPAVIQHLQILEASGLVTSAKEGRVRTCRIEPKALRAAEKWIASQRETWERRLDRLESFLAEQDEEAKRPADSKTSQGRRKP